MRKSFLWILLIVVSLLSVNFVSAITLLSPPNPFASNKYFNGSFGVDFASDQNCSMNFNGYSFWFNNIIIGNYSISNTLFNNNQFNDSTIQGTIFVNESYQTRYLSIPMGVNVTSATLRVITG